LPCCTGPATADINRSGDPNARDYVFSEKMMDKFMQEISEFRTEGPEQSPF
jgi:hypothetical protein